MARPRGHAADRVSAPGRRFLDQFDDPAVERHRLKAGEAFDLEGHVLLLRQLRKVGFESGLLLLQPILVRIA